uniref:Uncharacterized protein n=1 Tax=Schistocephalus solidus TaxID=70667 RepID=A0A0X3Q540_SCHSO
MSFSVKAIMARSSHFQGNGIANAHFCQASLMLPCFERSLMAFDPFKKVRNAFRCDKNGTGFSGGQLQKELTGMASQGPWSSMNAYRSSESITYEKVAKAWRYYDRANDVRYPTGFNQLSNTSSKP